MKKISSTDLEQYFLPSRLQTIDSVLDRRTRSLTLVLDRVHQPHNVAAVLRSADAFGICELHFIGDEVEHHRMISRGSERWVDLHRHDSAESALRPLLEAGFTLVLLEAPHEKSHTEAAVSMPVFDLPFEERLAIVFGNEHSGISDEIKRFPHITAFIPMLGFVESLNISVAAAITLFCATAKVSATPRRTQPLTPDEREELRKRWFTNDLRNGSAIIRRMTEE